MIETLLEVELVSIWLSSLPQSLLLDDQRLVSAKKKTLDFSVKLQVYISVTSTEIKSRNQILLYYKLF